MDWNLLLKVWAVLGPLAAAGCSAVWARRNQVQDRNHGQAQQRQARKEALEDRQADRDDNLKQTHRLELRLALAQFISASSNAVHASLERKHNPSAENDKWELEALSKMNALRPNVTLLSTAEIAKEVDRVVGLTADFSTIYPPDLLKTLTEHSKKYHLAVAHLESAARSLLASRCDG